MSQTFQEIDGKAVNLDNVNFIIPYNINKYYNTLKPKFSIGFFFGSTTEESVPNLIGEVIYDSKEECRKAIKEDFRIVFSKKYKK